MRGSGNTIAGFSLVELLAIMLLLGIVSVVVIARLDIDPFRTAGFEQELRSTVRFAQKFAIVSGCDVQVAVDAAADSYALSLRNDVAAPSDCLTAGAGFGVPLNAPGTGSAAAGTAPGNVDITTGLTFFYDGRGRPSASGAVVVDGQSITIEPVTGYVY